MGPKWDKDFVANAAQLACTLEASAEKPGNVTPRHASSEMRYEDMLRSAFAIAPDMARAGRRGLGVTVLAAITATRRWARVNTNLGIVLLLAPLAKAALDESLTEVSLRRRVGQVLCTLDIDDTRDVYSAIRLAEPGGLGRPVEHDVRGQPTVTLREAMASASGRDSIASEYVSDFAITFGLGLPALRQALDAGLGTLEAVTQAYLDLLVAVPDTLIARKHGVTVARRISDQAAHVMAEGGLLTSRGRRALAVFDADLRDPDHALNPGTTADLITAAIFIAVLDGML